MVNNMRKYPSIKTNKKKRYKNLEENNPKIYKRIVKKSIYKRIKDFLIGLIK